MSESVSQCSKIIHKQGVRLITRAKRARREPERARLSDSPAFTIAGNDIAHIE